MDNKTESIELTPEQKEIQQMIDVILPDKSLEDDKKANDEEKEKRGDFKIKLLELAETLFDLSFDEIEEDMEKATALKPNIEDDTIDPFKEPVGKTEEPDKGSFFKEVFEEDRSLTSEEIEAVKSLYARLYWQKSFQEASKIYPNKKAWDDATKRQKDQE